MNINYGLLKTLVNVHSVTGDTLEIRKFLKSKLSELNIEYKEDTYGTIVFGNLVSPDILVASHIDEIGFQITKIEDNGKIRFLPIGWVFPNRMDHTVVYIFVNGNYIKGLVIHEEELKAQNISDFDKLYIDVGVDNLEGVLELGIRPGQTGSFSKEYYENDSIVIASSIDNKVSQFSLLSVIENDRSVLDNNMFAFITDEEMQDHSANGICFNYKSNLAIVLDYCPVHQEPGKGDVFDSSITIPMLMYRGGSYIIHSHARDYFENQINSGYTIGFLSSNTLPVLEPSNFEENGHTVAVNLCIPARGYHGASYIIRKRGIENYIQLLSKILKKGYKISS